MFSLALHDALPISFVDLGKGRNAVLYAGEVNWDAVGMEGQPRRIEQALSSGDSVLVQVTKDPIGHKGARLTAQVTLAGRYLEIGRASCRERAALAAVAAPWAKNDTRDSWEST